MQTIHLVGKNQAGRDEWTIFFISNGNKESFMLLAFSLPRQFLELPDMTRTEFEAMPINTEDVMCSGIPHPEKDPIV